MVGYFNTPDRSDAALVDYICVQNALLLQIV